MPDLDRISEHWASGDVYARIIAAMEAVSISPDSVTVEVMAQLDHFHARGLSATVELAENLPLKAGQHIVDIGCGIGGPARYLAERYGCKVSGIDITEPFIEAANKLTALLKLEGQVMVTLGDGQHLPYDDAMFDGGYAQHVTMNIGDRARFYAEAYRVLKPGAFFAVTEHGLGEAGDPHYPLPWSEDGSGAYLLLPEDSVAYLQGAGFSDIAVEDTGPKYLAGYNRAIELGRQGALSPFGVHVLLGANAPDKVKNAARNIAEGRTRPVQIICRKPS